MPKPVNPPPPQAIPAIKAHRLLVGMPMFALCIAGLVWAVSLAGNAIAFGKIPPAADSDKGSIRLASEFVPALERLVKSDPGDGVVRKRLASELARQGDYARALEQVQIAQQTANTPDGYFLMADLQDKLHRADEAVLLMGDAMALNPGNPQYRDAYLRLLGGRMARVNAERKGTGVDVEHDANSMNAHRAYALEARDWAVRAPNDANSYLFLANDCVGPPVLGWQAYRLFLAGLSRAPGMTLTNEYMIQPGDAIGTIHQIIELGFSKAYRGIAFEASAAPAGGQGNR